MKAQVLLPKVFNFPFTYYNNQTSLRIGDFVEVPFGKNKEIAYKKALRYLYEQIELTL